MTGSVPCAACSAVVAGINHLYSIKTNKQHNTNFFRKCVQTAVQDSPITNTHSVSAQRLPCWQIHNLWTHTIITASPPRSWSLHTVHDVNTNTIQQYHIVIILSLFLFYYFYYLGYFNKSLGTSTTLLIYQTTFASTTASTANTPAAASITSAAPLQSRETTSCIYVLKVEKSYTFICNKLVKSVLNTWGQHETETSVLHAHPTSVKQTRKGVGLCTVAI